VFYVLQYVDRTVDIFQYNVCHLISSVSLWIVQWHIWHINLYRVLYWDAYMLLVIMWTALFPSCSPKIVAMRLSPSFKYPCYYSSAICRLKKAFIISLMYQIWIHSLLDKMTSHICYEQHLWIHDSIAHILYHPVPNEFMLNNVVVQAYAQPLVSCCECKSRWNTSFLCQES
jgi:hypothetical protein